MSKKLFFTGCLVALSFLMFAQSKTPSAGTVHKIVFQLSSDDTLVHKALVRQLNNVLNAAPNAKIEVVCHGPGINFLVSGKTVVLDKIQLLRTKGVAFEACENTLKEKNISKDKIIAEAGFVQSALIEIVTRQEEGWSYIKAGF
jgi:intracellular sulfur oxidation DsrE/DsrF family protein